MSDDLLVEESANHRAHDEAGEKTKDGADEDGHRSAKKQRVCFEPTGSNWSVNCVKYMSG